MNVDQVAALTIQWFNDPGYVPPESGPVNRERAIMMVAIANRESGFNEKAQGDKGLNGTWQSGGYCSFGLWQVYLPVHHGKVAAYMGISDDPFQANRMAEWLMVAENNARAARDILYSQGPQAWSVYTNDSWKGFVPQATEAVDRILQPAPVTKYVTRIIEEFSDGTQWVLDVVPPQ